MHYKLKHFHYGLKVAYVKGIKKMQVIFSLMIGVIDMKIYISWGSVRCTSTFEYTNK